MKEIKKIFFLGIGGIGMSALAKYFHQKNIQIIGYDKTVTPLTKSLQNLGITVFYNDDISLFPTDIDFVVTTPAIPIDNNINQYIKKHNIQTYKRAEILGMISEELTAIAVAGTHGKTSITSLITHIFKYADKNITGFIGGISRNYSSNFVGSTKQNPEIGIFEADEYDRSFMKLHPDWAIISSVDVDHLDIYNDEEDFVNTFVDFTNLLTNKSQLLVNYCTKDILSVNNDTYTYALNEKADFYAQNAKIVDGLYHFDINYNGFISKNNVLGIPGKYNLENSIAAAAISFLYGIEAKIISEALSSYKGVERRFDLRINNNKNVYIDDYAHHPTEIDVCIKSVRELYPNSELTIVFQPHLYSRTRDFLSAFAASLDKADNIILLDIYPAREKPIKGINSGAIIEKMKSNNTRLLSKENALEYIHQNKPQLLLSLGAGDIGLMVNQIEKAINE